MIEEWCFACYGAGFIQVSNVNIVCPTCHGQGTLYKGEQQMSEDGTATVTFGNGPLDAVQEEINKYKEIISKQEETIDNRRSELRKVQTQVYEFFNTQFDGGEEEVTITRDEANELLEEIGAQQLQQEFEGTVTVTFSFTVKAQDEDDARSIVEDAVSGLENQIDAGSDDSYSQDDISVDL